MSSKTNSPSDLIGEIPKSSRPISTQIVAEMPSVNVSNQIELETSSTPGADVNNDIEKTEGTKSAIAELSEELKDSKKKVDNSDVNENGETDDTAFASDSLPITFINKRIAKQFRVSSTNKIHEYMGGKVNKIYFGTVESLLPEKEMWRILYDDGDVDIMSRANLLDALKYYDLNRKYDTNHAHKKIFSPLAPLSEEGKEKCEEGSAINVSTNIKSKKKSKSNTPKKGKKAIAKVARKEPLAEWIGPPDEHLDGGWPKGWVKKIFARKNGVSKGSTDRYWYTPKEKFKLRSMVQVRKFLKALFETKGDEKKAKATMANY